METRGDAAEKKLEEQWRECEAAFRAVFDMSPVALYLHRDGRFVRLNAAALGLFGAQDAAQLIGQSIFDRSPAGEGAAHRARIQEALDGTPEPRFTETRLLRLDGAEVDVEVLDRLVSYQGQPTLLASTHDIRERRQAETAAIAYGYELEVTDPNAVNPAHVSLLIRGRSLADAASLVQRMGLVFRIGSQDGRGALLTDDMRYDRVTVTVMAGVVTDACPG